MTSPADVARALGVLAACYLPGFISAATVDEIRDDFAMSPAVLGAAFAIYWGMAAITSTPASRVVDRIGPVSSIRLAGLIAATSCAAVAVLVHSAPLLMLLLAFGGTSIALASPAANVILMAGIRPGRRATVFAISQSSPPLGILLAALAVPLLAQPLGWRPVYLCGAALALGTSLLVRTAPRRTAQTASPGLARPNLRPLALVMLGVTAGNASVGAMNAFLIDAAPSAGVSRAAAAVVLAAGAALSIVVRAHDPLPGVAALLTGGALGYALLATQAPALFVIGALFVLVFGWVWTSLFVYAVVTRYSTAVGAATGVLQTGFFAGGVLGPVVFGLVVEASSFSTAWLLVALGMLVAGVTVALARSTLPAHPAAAV
jgi:MFS transporter